MWIKMYKTIRPQFISQLFRFQRAKYSISAFYKKCTIDKNSCFIHTKLSFTYKNSLSSAIPGQIGMRTIREWTTYYSLVNNIMIAHIPEINKEYTFYLYFFNLVFITGIYLLNYAVFDNAADSFPVFFFGIIIVKIFITCYVLCRYSRNSHGLAINCFLNSS